MKAFIFALLVALGLNSRGQAISNKIICKEYESFVLTHGLTEAGPVPTAFDPDGVYPYVSYVETANRPAPVKYKFISLENDHIKVTICPDLGGKVTSLIHKPSGKETLYVPEVIRPTRILPRFYFVAGGIEVSFPISHSPTQNNKMLYEVDEQNGRTYVTCGERELRFGMQWTVEYSLGASDDFLTQRVVFHNPGKEAYPWMSWSNAAIPSAADTKFYFPEGSVLSHSSVIDTIDWKNEGPVQESDIREMTGYFWLAHNINAFGVFTPSFGSGVFHIADESVAPGMKLWSYGLGSDAIWATLSTASRMPYIEIQGGPIRDQSIKLELQPGETNWHVEYWFPVDQPMNIGRMNVPDVKLRQLDEVPLFGWARQEEVAPWIDLEKAYKENRKVPDPPHPTQNCWPPSGMENLGTIFQWAIAKSDSNQAGKAKSGNDQTDNNLARNDLSGFKQSDVWKFYYGTWIAGRGDTAKATVILNESGSGIAKALLSRLLRLKRDNAGAVRVYRSIQEQWLQIHPQIVIERDKALRNLGKETLNERESWLRRVDALEDEWVIERRVQLLIDRGDAEAAKRLLLSTHFQKVHQTYTRTFLWFQIQDMLQQPRFPIPDQLGEDRLARFGAYREFRD